MNIKNQGAKKINKTGSSTVTECMDKEVNRMMYLSLNSFLGQALAKNVKMFSVACNLELFAQHPLALDFMNSKHAESMLSIKEWNKHCMYI